MKPEGIKKENGQYFQSSNNKGANFSIEKKKEGKTGKGKRLEDEQRHR